MIQYIHFPTGHRFYEMSEPWITGSGDSWSCRYYDHHTVKQVADFTTQERAKDYAFMWRTVRGMFTTEIYGGCIYEVAGHWRLPVFVMSEAE